MDINQRRGRFLRVPRELVAIFPPTAQRAILNYFEAITEKVSDSTESLSDVEQKSLVPIFSMIRELNRRIEHLERDSNRRNLHELERKVAALEKASLPKAKIYELKRDIEDLKRSV